jgi:hypothetical protein
MYKMNADFDGPRISPAEFLSEAARKEPKSRHGTKVPGPSFIHPGFLNVAAIHGILTGNLA